MKTMSGARVAAVALLVAGALFGQPKRILYLTTSAGFRHDSIPVSVRVLTNLAAQSGKLVVDQTEDVSVLNAASLSSYDALLFFTSGELPLSDDQKSDLLNFIRSGKGFGGAHSATDTLYTWPAYGDLIGARFNGHPWTQSVSIDVEDPDHPAVSHLKPSFKILDEIYQFSGFSRSLNRVLLTLDTHSVDLTAPGVNPGTEDFPLAWCRTYGRGRVFYTALGHFDSTWLDPRFQQMMLQAMLWLTGQIDGDASPRPPKQPTLAANGIANSASFQPRMTIAPGALLTLFGQNLTAGSTLAADARTPPYKLAGTTVKLNASAIPLLYVSPAQVNAYVPLDAAPRQCTPPLLFGLCDGPYFWLDLSSAGGGPAGAVSAQLTAVQATPGVFTLTASRSLVTLWATGLGPVQPSGDFQITVLQPSATIGGIDARILFSGLAPGWLGLYQVNVEMPQNLTFPAMLDFRLGSFQQFAWVNPQ